MQNTFSAVKKSLILLFLGYWFYTFSQTHDYLNWVVENLLVFIFVGFFIWQLNTFKNSTLFSFTCIFLFVMMHISGSQYAYTHHPIGIWMKDAFHLQRNGFDRLVHFSFGLLITIPLQEYIVQKLEVKQKLASMISFLWISTFAAVFELIEWIIGGVLFPETGTDYVGTQGDVWDPQKDIALAMIASLTILLAYKPLFQRQAVVQSEQV
jgi:putative membrane protein